MHVLRPHVNRLAHKILNTVVWSLFSLLGWLFVMHRQHKGKDARRRARKAQQRAIQAGAPSTVARVIPDRRSKLLKRAERHDQD